MEFVHDSAEITPGMPLIANRYPFVGYFTCYPTIGGLEQQAPTAGDVKTVGSPELSAENPR